MSNESRVIVAGVGDLQADDPALVAAAALARRAGAVLHLVHAYELPRLLGTSPQLRAFPEAAEAYRANALRQLEAAAARAGAASSSCRVMEGSPGACLLEAAKETGAELLVVGAARGKRLSRMVLGSTAQRVLRQAPVPVLVVRRALQGPVGRLLVTGDMSELSAAVFEAALATLRHLLGGPGEVRALYVLPWSLLPPPLPHSALEEAARKQLAECLAHRPDHGFEVEPQVRVGEPAEQIVAEAEAWQAELLVVGTHARGWGARLLLGSVAEATLRDAPCNVLAVPPTYAAAPEIEPTCVESLELESWAQAAGVP
ncbi:MAG: universal stress protein [Longimicrobiaceae bacterium]